MSLLEFRQCMAVFLDIPAETTSIIRPSTLEVQSYIRRQDGPELAG